MRITDRPASRLGAVSYSLVEPRMRAETAYSALKALVVDGNIVPISRAGRGSNGEQRGLTRINLRSRNKKPKNRTTAPLTVTAAPYRQPRQ